MDVARPCGNEGGVGAGVGGGVGGGGSGGGGMSRAARKRAKKKRARTTSSASASDVKEGGVYGNTSISIDDKMQLPLDDGDDDRVDLKDAVQAFRKDSSSSKKKTKKKKKSKKDGAIEKMTTGANLNAVAAEKEKEAVEEMYDMEDEASTTEMEPELEALLSTLTPLQILLLDEGDSKMPEENHHSKQQIDPLHLIGDLATQHRARILLSSLLAPSGVTLYEFYKRYWEKRPLLATYLDQEEDEQQVDEEVAQRHATRLDGFLSRSIIDEMIQRNKLRHGLDLNITRFTDTMGNGLRSRVTLDPPPKKRKIKGGGDNDVEFIVANPKDIWSNVDTSHCTLRLLRPHEHADNVHAMLSLLESEFGCMVGCNAYLTPLHSQGFAPHFDDVDVFVLQLEGYKRWRVYAPFTKRETLPRESSRDYAEQEVEDMGAELMDVVLGPGDVMYLPRGWIHQAETVARPSHMPKIPGIKDDHSLHLTVSAMQNWSWADLLEILMPEALERAAASDKSISLREGLPRNFLSYMGTMHQLDADGEGGGSALPEGLKQVADAQAKASAQAGSDEEELDEEAMMKALSQQRTLVHQRRFRAEAKRRIMRVAKQAVSMLDDGCDQIGKRFLSDRLPPALLKPERCLTKEGLSTAGTVSTHHHDASKKIWPNTLCRLVRPNVARLVIEDNKAVLYHCLDNSRVYHSTPLSPMEFEVDDAPAIEQLLTTVEPHWIMVQDLLHGDIEDKIQICQSLYDEGILATMMLENPDRSVETG